MDRMQVTRTTVAARLDRLAITSFHRQIMWLLGFVFFSELGGINTFSFAAPAIMKSWQLSVSTIGFIVSATFIGMFLGATTGGWFSDRVGRKRALILTTVWYSGFSLLNAVVWGPAGLFITRLLTGVGLSAMTVVGITYVSEFAYLADGKNGLRVVQLTSPDTPGNYGFSPRPTPQLIASFAVPQKGQALAISEGVDRDRAVDESGNQISVFGRVGARPLNLEEQRRMYLHNGQVWKVSDDPRDSAYQLSPR